uniref:Reverse transcriptase Ty1/copia-type domain-containing protein n=1 Tax=Tanacetum cinerariifolium TaxID=118510 RepID=A0A6L2NX03_TANCI|nr:hypothetical protein [Tanacetum cinerariifolium]
MAMASEQSSSGPALNEMTPATISSGLVQKPSSSTPYVPPSRNDWDLMFQPMFDKLLNPSPSINHQAPNVIASIAKVIPPVQAGLTGSLSSTTVDQDTPSPIVQPDHQISQHNSKWTKDHPLHNIIGQLSRLVSTRLQLHEQSLFCYYDAFLTLVEPKTYKDALTQYCWIEAMQEELNEFERLEPDGFVDQDNPNHVYKLKKALYGLKQAPRTWYDMLSSFLISQDFSKGSVDPTLFIRRSDNDLLLGLWYPKDSSIALTAFVDADHAGCQDTRRSTSGSLQIYGKMAYKLVIKKAKEAAICKVQKLLKHATLWLAIISDSNMVFIIKASIPKKRKLDLTTGINYLRHGLLYDHAKACDYFASQPVLSTFHKYVSEIYMQEFWATATVHHHSIRFKMDNKKHIVNLESFREMLHICLRLPGQSFVEPPFEEEILSFLRFLGHRKAQAMIAYGYLKLKFFGDYTTRGMLILLILCGKTLSIRLNIKTQRRAMKCIILGSRRLSSTTSCQRILLFQGEIRNSNAYKEYYAVATGATPPKPKASVRKTRSSSDTTVTPPSTAAAGPRLSTSAKGKQPATTSTAKNKGTGALPRVPDVPTDESEEEVSWKFNDEEGDDDEGDDEQDDDDQEDEGNDEDDKKEGSDDEQAFDEEEFIHSSLSTHATKETKDEESFDPIPKTPENTNDEGNGRGLQTSQEFKDSYVTLTLVNPDGQQQSSSVSSQFVTSMLNLTPDAEMESIFETTSQIDVSTPALVAPIPMSALTLTPSTIATITTTLQAPTPPTIAPSTLLQDLPNFGSLLGFDNRLKTLEANFSKFMQTNQFAGTVASIPSIVQRYMDQRMKEAVKVAIQIQSNRLHDEAQA